MVEQYGRVRRLLARLLNTVKFSAAPAGSATLNACDYLSREFSSRRQYFDDAPTEIIIRPWKRLVINKEKHITRRGYTLCFLSKLQDSLRRRHVYVTGIDRWGDPRARLLRGVCKPEPPKIPFDVKSVPFAPFATPIQECCSCNNLLGSTSILRGGVWRRVN